jgi:hypothetical protein
VRHVVVRRIGAAALDRQHATLDRIVAVRLQLEFRAPLGATVVGAAIVTRVFAVGRSRLVLAADTHTHSRSKRKPKKKNKRAHNQTRTYRWHLSSQATRVRTQMQLSHVD